MKNRSNIILEAEEIMPMILNETAEVFENANIKFQVEETLETQVETTIENPPNEIPVTEGNLIILQEFNLETFILDILKQQNQISLTELASKVKTARSDKKKMTNTELEKEIVKTETLEVTKAKTKMIIRRTGFDFKQHEDAKMASS